MSGGRYDYAYYKLQELACDIEPTSKDRKWFKKLLEKCAIAAKDVEWVDSGDCSEETFTRSLNKIKAFLGKAPKPCVKKKR